MTTRPAAIVNEYSDTYPLCCKLGLLEAHGNMVYVPFDRLKEKLTPLQWEAWCNRSVAQTSSIHGFYAWDVERFLEQHDGLSGGLP